MLITDCNDYNEVFKRFLNLNQTDKTEAYKLMKLSLKMAQRFSELQASSNSFKEQYKDFKATEFKAWCYERYRQMQLLHEACRVIWRANA